jgi:hypothetical protein
VEFWRQEIIRLLLENWQANNPVERYLGQGRVSTGSQKAPQRIAEEGGAFPFTMRRLKTVSFRTEQLICFRCKKKTDSSLRSE